MAAAPRQGQVVKFRNRDRTEYMRLVTDATVTGIWLTLYGYRTRANGVPIRVRPVARHLPAAGVEIIAGVPGE